MQAHRAFQTQFLDAMRKARSFDADAVTRTIQQSLASAGLDMQSGPMKSVADTISRALSSAGAMGRSARPASPAVDESVIDVAVNEIGRSRHAANDEAVHPLHEAERVRPGQFLSRAYANHAGAREYKLYVPSCYSTSESEPMPMVVMLHGCTQCPDDFAAGTRMNMLAEQHGFLVVYPAQAATANGSKCWNWFKPEDQSRDDGEPALIAGITREVAASYRVDKRRIFVAGLSAGAAMAVILGATYPELYAAVGAHSGLAFGAAHDLPSAFAAMHAGGNGPLACLPGLQAVPGTPRKPRAAQAVPTIVFHGDHDQTVTHRNAIEIVEQATVHPAAGASGSHRSTQMHRGVAPGGRAYSRTVHVDAADRPVAELWVLHGAGHAWSGGSSKGSFTDGTGPDASAEMVRFFYSQMPAGSARD